MNSHSRGLNKEITPQGQMRPIEEHLGNIEADGSMFRGMHLRSRGLSDEITPKGLHKRSRGLSVATPPVGRHDQILCRRYNPYSPQPMNEAGMCSTFGTNKANALTGGSASLNPRLRKLCPFGTGCAFNPRLRLLCPWPAARFGCTRQIEQARLLSFARTFGAGYAINPK